MPLGFVTTFFAILALPTIYSMGYAGGHGVIRGVRFGVLVGIFAACAFVGENYVILNIGRKLASELAAAVLFQWTVVGMVISVVYKPAAH